MKGGPLIITTAVEPMTFLPHILTSVRQINPFPPMCNPPQSITVSDATGGSFMVTLDLTANGGSVQTSGEIAYNADATGGRTSVQGILEVQSVLGVSLRLGNGNLLCNDADFLIWALECQACPLQPICHLVLRPSTCCS